MNVHKWTRYSSSNHHRILKHFDFTNMCKNDYLHIFCEAVKMDTFYRKFFRHEYNKLSVENFKKVY